MTAALERRRQAEELGRRVRVRAEQLAEEPHEVEQIGNLLYEMMGEGLDINGEEAARRISENSHLKGWREHKKRSEAEEALSDDAYKKLAQPRTHVFQQLVKMSQEREDKMARFMASINADQEEYARFSRPTRRPNPSDELEAAMRERAGKKRKTKQ